jgi:hypothetical protein
MPPTTPPFDGYVLPEQHATRYPPIGERARHFVATAPADLKELAEEIVAASPAMHIDTVLVSHPNTRSRWEILTVYRGPLRDVVERVAHHIAHANCTQQYEHMLPTLRSVNLADDDQITICLHTSLYAGD